jgi:PAS domain S-box-containing protein
MKSKNGSTKEEESERDGDPFQEILFSLEGIPVATADINGDFIHCNSAFIDLLGYTEEELSSKSVFDLTHPDEVEISKKKISEVARGKITSYRIQKRYRKKDGDTIWVDISVASIKKMDGKQGSLVGIFKDITHAKELEVKLRKNSILLESILNSINDTIGIQNPDHTIVRYNEAGYRFLNMTQEEVEGKKCYELVGRDDPCSICATSKVYETKKPERVERYEESMDAWLDVRAYPVLNEEGEIEYIVEHLRDITESKKNEIELEEARQMYMDTLNNMNDAVLLINKDLVIELANKSFKSLLRKAGIRRKPEGNNIFDLQPFLPEAVSKEYETVMKSGRTMETDEITKINEREFHTHTIKIPLMKEDRVDKIITVIRETTDQMYYLNQLREGEKRVRNIIESSPDAITIADLEGIITDCNEATLLLHGISSKEEVIGRKAIDFLDERDHERALVNTHRVLSGGRIDDIEYTLKRDDGTRFPGRMSASLMVDSKGTPEAFIAITSDITERKRFEKDLQRRLDYEYLISLISSEFINTSPEKIDESIEKVLRMAGEFVHADRAYVFLFRNGNQKMDNTHEWNAEGISSEKGNLQDLDPSDFYVVREYLLKMKMIYLPSMRNLPMNARNDREEFEREGIKSLLNAPMICEGNLIGFIGFDSVGKHATWERETIDFLRLIGQIIATTLIRFKSQVEIIKERERAEFYLDLLGHDIGNLHQGIYSGLQIARNSNDEEIKDLSMDSTEDLVKRSIKLVKNVLLLSRLGLREPELSKVDLKEALENSILQVQKIYSGKEIDIEVNMTKGRIFVLAEPIIEEVFLNILHNGIKFQERRIPKLEISLKKSRSNATVTISDHGTGIPKTSKEKLFSRFSPKGKGSQTGIGLSLVKALTDRYGGEVKVEDRVEGDYRKGTKFIVKYPLA